eukprot:gene12815-17180_t
MKNANDYFYFCAGGIAAISVYALANAMISSRCSRTSTRTVGKRLVNRLSSWKEGINQPIPFRNKKNWKTFNPSSMKAADVYYMMISAVIPRPIALVSSVDINGIINCAPYSYFNLIGHDPPLVIIGCCLNTRVGTKKDTLNNIEATGQFVVNIMSEWYIDSANHTCGNFSPEVNEMELAGLTSIPSQAIKPPRVGEAAIQMECEVYDLKPVHNNANVHTQTLIIGKIIRIHLHDEVLVPGSGEKDAPLIDWEKLNPMCRLGGDSYATITDVFDLTRPVRNVVTVTPANNSNTNISNNNNNK